MITAVTGASGFIGSFLARELAGRGHAVRALSRRRVAASDDGGVTHRQIDYSDAAALTRVLDGVDVVFHAAGVTRSAVADGFQAGNVQVTRGVLDAMPGTARLVFLSSQAAAGPARSLEHPTVETDEPQPIEEYGRTKLDAERVIADQSRVAWSVVRPASVYGPRDRDFLQLFRLAAQGLAVHPANRENWISIIHVRDLVDGIMRAGFDPTALGRVYFMANEEPMQWSELFAIAARATGRNLTVDLEVPSFLVDIGARLGDAFARLSGDASLLTSNKVALSKAKYWVCSSERARRELGFAPRTRLDEGFAETFRWYRQNRWL